MTAPVAGIDPHQNQFTIGIIDAVGVELTHGTFPNTARGFAEAIDLLVTHGVAQVGIEGSASWGAHVAIAIWPPGRRPRGPTTTFSGTTAVTPAGQDRRHRRDRHSTRAAGRTNVGSCSGSGGLRPARRRARSRPLSTAAPWWRPERCCCTMSATNWPSCPPIRDQLPATGKLESRLRKLGSIDAAAVSTRAGAYRVSWLIELVDQDRRACQQIRALERRIGALLDEHGTTLRDEAGVGPITAATLLCEVGDPFRFARESKFARWSGTGAVALSSGEGNDQPVRHRLDTGGNHSADDAVGEVAFVCASGFASGLAFCGLTCQEGLRVWMAALLGEADDVQQAVVPKVVDTLIELASHLFKVSAKLLHKVLDVPLPPWHPHVVEDDGDRPAYARNSSSS